MIPGLKATEAYIILVANKTYNLEGEKLCHNYQN